ncbi:MAG: hypothetical protein Q4B73_06860 [Lachnospiraceae bacterium]|nr:hypothetical protein [Lachnospiraceae bacterium]
MNQKATAIIYTSNTGHTKAFAELLGERSGLPVYELKAAMKDCPAGTPIIYMGWLMAGSVKGFKDAAKRFDVKALCAVGMAGGDGQKAGIVKACGLPAEVPVFVLQGGFELDKLSGLYKMMMKTMKNTVGKKLAAKPDKTAEEMDMLDLFENGGSRVSAEQLEPVLAWLG